MIFREKLRMLLASRNMRQRELAEVVGRTQAKISGWMVGPGSKAQGLPLPRLGEAVKIARYFGVPLDYLCDDEITEPGQVAPRHPDEFLGDAERKVLAIAKEVGYDLAVRRMLKKPDDAPGPGPEPWSEPGPEPKLSVSVSNLPPKAAPTAPPAPKKKPVGRPKKKR